MAKTPKPARKPDAQPERTTQAPPEQSPVETHLDAICGGLAGGQSLRAICRDIGVGESTVRYWLTRDEDARAQVEAARLLGCDAMADECIDIADEKVVEPVEVQNKKIRIDTRLRLIGKWHQHRYGDKVGIQQTHKFDPEVAEWLGLKS